MQYCFAKEDTYTLLVQLTAPAGAAAAAASTYNMAIMPVISLNLDGSLGTMLELANIIEDIKPMAVLLQDVPYLSNQRLKQTCEHIASGYKIITRRPIQGINVNKGARAKHYHLILTKSDQLTEIIAANEDTSTKASTLMVCVRDGHDHYSGFILASVYIRPRSDWDKLKTCLELIEATARKSTRGLARTIIMGDFNALHANWTPIADIANIEQLDRQKANRDKNYTNIKLNRGRTITTFYQRLKLTLLNKIEEGPTFVSNQATAAAATNRTAAYIDLAIVGSQSARHWKQFNVVAVSPNSQHRALVIKPHYTFSYNSNRRFYYKTDLINNEHFIELRLMTTNNMIYNWKHPDPTNRDLIIERMNLLTDMVCDCLNQIQETIKRETNLTCNIQQPRPVQALNSFTRTLIRRTAKIEEQLNKLKNNRKLTPARRIKIKQLTIKRDKLRNKTINSINHDKFDQKTADQTENSFWENFELANEIIDPKTPSCHMRTKDDEKDISTLEDLERLLMEKFPQIPREYDHAQLANEPILLTDNEIKAAIKELRNKKYTGPDGIKFTVFNEALKYIPDIISTICQISFYTCCTPKHCQMTLGTLIPKKTSGEYRIVHVSSPLSVLLEQIALNRLEHAIEITGQINKRQYGFTALRNRHDLIARAFEVILKGRRQDGHTYINHKQPNTRRTPTKSTIISLDIEGAFDNVCQDSLIDKLLSKLDNQNIKYWIANFILNRNIRITIKSNNDNRELISQPKRICLGVPQGSCLGPILWNYTISEIDQDINIPRELEVLAYADDLFIVHNKNNRQKLQAKLDHLTDKLEDIGLRVRPEKCAALTIPSKTSDKAEPTYTLYGIRLRNVRSMNILGVPITRALKLDTSHPEVKNKILENCSKLNQIHQLNIIHTNEEWRILLESYLYSITYMNLGPILAIDKRGRQWCNNVHNKMLKFIFNWPSNTSNKIVRLITGCRLAKTELLRMVASRIETEHKSSYRMLLSLLKHDKLDSCKTQVIQRIRMTKLKDISNERLTKRRYADPTKLLNLDDNNTNITDGTRYTAWIVTELGSRQSMFTELVEPDIILQNRGFRHLTYPTGYFNTFAGLWHLVMDTNNRSATYSTNIILPRSNALLQALVNSKNHDHRIIQLREKLIDKQWVIYIVPNNSLINLQANILEQMRLPNVDAIRIMDIDGEQVPRQEHDDNDPLEQQEQLAPIHRYQTIVTGTLEPLIHDYKWRSITNKRYEAKLKVEGNSNLTTTSRIICNNYEQWLKSPPGWIKGPTMLMLSNLYTTESGTLDSTSSRQVENQEDMIDEDMCDCGQSAYSHILFHRALECQKYKRLRQKLITDITKLGIFIETYRDDADETLLDISLIEFLFQDNKAKQRLLRHLTDCAFTTN